VLWAQRFAGGSGVQMCFAVTDTVSSDPPGATDMSMIRATVTAFF